MSEAAPLIWKKHASEAFTYVSTCGRFKVQWDYDEQANRLWRNFAGEWRPLTLHVRVKDAKAAAEALI